jgi:hypothetical protein
MKHFRPGNLLRNLRDAVVMESIRTDYKDVVAKVQTKCGGLVHASHTKDRAVLRVQRKVLANGIVIDVVDVRGIPGIMAHDVDTWVGVYDV